MWCTLTGTWCTAQRERVNLLILSIKTDYPRQILAFYRQPCKNLLQHVLADVWVVKSSELGAAEDNIHCRTHLGHLLQVGDSCLG